MSELSEAVQNLRNMRESYDQLAGAAEAYNEGKTALAEAITAKGVEAAATDSLATMAEKVMTISQDTYEINGGEMYAKQLFGSLETSNYWNLYDIMAQLLSDGRLVNYGGILLAGYNRGYDSLALSGAGAGGAYVVSDKDANGQFIMYTEDTTHTWKIGFGGEGDRWVAYCFADENHDFEILDTNTSPRAIYIGRKVGNLRCLVSTRITDLIVSDGNELAQFSAYQKTHNMAGTIIVRNVKKIDGFVGANSAIQKFYTDADEIGLNGIFYNAQSILSCVILAPKSKTLNVYGNIIIDNGISGALIICANKIQINNYTTFCYGNVKEIFLVDIEQTAFNEYGLGAANNTCKYIYCGYDNNDKTKAVTLNFWVIPSTIEIVELKDGWCKPFNMSRIVTTGLNEENIYKYILQRLKQDEADCGDGVTITLGATNLAKLTSEESVALLDSLTNVYGYTFA